ncbi:MAG TPA: septum formation initiator family protein [Gammaproteobacteria bacterium]|nr:septum formation initiator family protein [Gammaproteobacteria bacterium]
MRWTIALFAFALVAMQLELWFGDERRPRLKQFEREVAAQSATNRVLAETNADLRAEITSLRAGDEAAEERARSELGLIEPGETYYQIVETEDRFDRE